MQAQAALLPHVNRDGPSLRRSRFGTPAGLHHHGGGGERHGPMDRATGGETRQSHSLRLILPGQYVHCSPALDGSHALALPTDPRIELRGADPTAHENS